jgi:hypothetical protein
MQNFSSRQNAASALADEIERSYHKKTFSEIVFFVIQGSLV